MTFWFLDYLNVNKIKLENNFKVRLLRYALIIQLFKILQLNLLSSFWQIIYPRSQVKNLHSTLVYFAIYLINISKSKMIAKIKFLRLKIFFHQLSIKLVKKIIDLKLLKMIRILKKFLIRVQKNHPTYFLDWWILLVRSLIVLLKMKMFNKIKDKMRVKNNKRN